MQLVPEPERSEMIRRLRERARLDADELVARPPFTILGLAAPTLRPAWLTESGRVNDAWSSVTLAYGDWTAPAGPHVSVTTAAASADDAGARAETELLRAIDTEHSRLAAQAGVDDEEPAGPPDYTRSRLPAGDALVCSHGGVWAMRLLDGDAGVTITVTGRGVDPEAVRLAPAGDLRPYFEARNEILGQLAERRRHIPPPVLAPAEGVAALRALADSALESHARIVAAVRAGRAPRTPAGWGPLHAALWQRAVSERQRVAGVDRPAADYAVTLAINQLTHLAEEAPWFATPRLRAAAIDETLRHAMLGDDVRSAPAQELWARYWAARAARRGQPPDPAGMLAGAQADQRGMDAWRAAWAAWAEGA